MIPCLYKSSETDFDANNGIGKLADCVSCVVTEKRNGEYELSMTYPSEGIHADDLEEEAIILAKPSDTADSQPFRIYKITKSMDATIEVAAQHISYQLNYITVSPCQSVTGTYDQPAAAMETLKNHATTDCPFTFESDVESSAIFTLSEPASFRAALGGIDGSVLDTYGGEYEWDRYAVRLWENRGSDNGVRIVYGKNLVDFKHEKSVEDVITGVHPYWIDNETGDVKEISGKVVTLSGLGYAYDKVALLDCSDQFDEEPTEEDLIECAEEYLNTTTTVDPNIDIDIDFAQLWGLPEYADIAEAEHVSMCDTVHVFVPSMNIEVAMSVTETEYDTLLERYNSLTLSTSKTSSRNSSIEVTLATTSNVKSMIAMTDTSIRLSVSDKYVSKDDITGYPTTTEVESMIEVSEKGITESYTESIKTAVNEINDDLEKYYSKTEEVKSMIEISEKGITESYEKYVEEEMKTITDDLEENYYTSTEIESMISLSEEGITESYKKYVEEETSKITDDLSENYYTSTQVDDKIELSEEGITADYKKYVQSETSKITDDLSENYSTTEEIESMISLSEEGITADYKDYITEQSKGYSTTEEVEAMISESKEGIEISYTVAIKDVTDDLSENYSTTEEIESM
ncbi:MAG: hypothetical protein LUD50_04800, partial [Clostridia bacterium]|nr:hypothetical protein [Clostridia bacterium]